DVKLEDVAHRLFKPRGKTSLSNHLRKALRMSPVKIALLQELGRPFPEEAGKLAQLIKALPVPVAGLNPMDEAISTSGGVAWESLDESLMIRDLPGVFCAGEMLDWAAPTGGYLLNGCLATGRWAG
ncbi:MAG TPA: aminoacetone oxidase family FAD-binding enzyme, partial [Sulfitobacter sp.]|nr:aminoacetone oxidase family FAD-binding enzyme [Sulfitobacter sp.]